MYKIYLAGVRLPILPEKLTEKGSKDNETFDVLAVGEVIKPGRKKLKTWEISAAFEGGGDKTVAFYKALIETLADSPDPFRFVVNRVDDGGKAVYETNTLAVIQDYKFEDREGEPGDIYYTIKLTEYKEFVSVVIPWS